MPRHRPPTHDTTVMATMTSSIVRLHPKIERDLADAQRRDEPPEEA